MATTNSTPATSAARPLPAHPGHPRPDLRQLLLILLPALLALLQLAAAVRTALRQLGEQFLVHLLRGLAMRVPTVLRARSSSGRPPAWLPLPARERRRLPLGRSLRRLQLTLQLPDAFPQLRILGFHGGDLRLGGLQGHPIRGEMEFGCDMECDVGEEVA